MKTFTHLFQSVILFILAFTSFSITYAQEADYASTLSNLKNDISSIKSNTAEARNYIEKAHAVTTLAETQSYAKKAIDVFEKSKTIAVGTKTAVTNIIANENLSSQSKTNLAEIQVAVDKIFDALLRAHRRSEVLDKTQYPDEIIQNAEKIIPEIEKIEASITQLEIFLSK
jgi:hypothetical protein